MARLLTVCLSPCNFRLLSNVWQSSGCNISHNGVTTNYAYDDLNRLTTISYPDLTSATYGYDEQSRLITATNPSGSVGFTYDNRGRVATTTDVWAQTLEYSYYENGNRTATTWNSSTYTGYTYDAADRLTQSTDSNSLAVNYSYDVMNRLVSRILPNGVASTETYDGLDRLTRLTDVKGNERNSDNQYSHNTANQIVGNVDLGGTHAYEYDLVDRLLSATYSGTDDEEYTYDGVGNRTSSAVFGEHVYDPFNLLVSDGGPVTVMTPTGNLVEGPYPLGSANLHLRL